MAGIGDAVDMLPPSETIKDGWRGAKACVGFGEFPCRPVGRLLRVSISFLGCTKCACSMMLDASQQ